VRRALGVALAAWPLLSFQPGASEGPTSTFRSSVEVVHVHVSTSDGQGRPVAGLERDDFRILEDGVPQAIEFFAAAAAVPVELIIMIDTSASMSVHLPRMKKAAIGLVRNLRAGDRAAIVEFNEHVRIRAGLTSDRFTLEKAIAEVRPGGQTALYTSIYVALSDLSDRDDSESPEASFPRRRALVVLSDGRNTFGVIDFDRVLEVAQRSNTSVYTISMRSGATVQPDPEALRARYELRALAEGTGARAFLDRPIGDLTYEYGAIVEELSQQYTLGYMSTNSLPDGAFRQVQVTILEPGVEARTRAGYFAPRAGAAPTS
jgi:VWFA-related protein